MTDLKPRPLTRRRLLGSLAAGGVATSLGAMLPAWAQSHSAHHSSGHSMKGAKNFDLTIGKFPVHIDGRMGHAIGVNGTVPGPLLRFRQGDDITLNVKNTLGVDSSIHWHGLLLPFQMDGVPGVTFPGIKPNQTFTYKFPAAQSGTYWYHSHSGLQEQAGHYGPIIIDPKGADPVAYDREYVIVLSDWSFMHPHKIFAGLKKMGESFNYQKPTALEFIKDARKSGLSAAMKERAMWGGMRMSPADIADIAGENYTYLINGHGPKDNWTGIFNSGERVRLRFINASAMSIMNVRIPGLEMQVVANDGQNVAPVNVYEFQMGVAETYDVIVRPTGNTPFAIVAESIDRSGMAVATLAPKGQENARAVAPLLRAPPRLTMKDMGHDMSNMDMEAMDHSKMDHSKMGHDMPKMDMEAMDMAKMDHSNMDMQSHNHAVDFGVANTAMAPTSRLSEPGAGLEHVGHKVLNYTMLKSLTPNPDLREPTREIEIHLTSNMERYMWSFNGVKFAHIKEAIKFYKGERIRMYLINDTMMNHPIHLHGMFFQLNNGAPHDRRPNKHTIIVKPGEKLSVDISAEHIGDWAFHCHLLYHMHAGMMQVVSVLPASGKPQNSIMDHSKMDHSNMDHSKMAPSKTGGMK